MGQAVLRNEDPSPSRTLSIVFSNNRCENNGAPAISNININTGCAASRQPTCGEDHLSRAAFEQAESERLQRARVLIFLLLRIILHIITLLLAIVLAYLSWTRSAAIFIIGAAVDVIVVSQIAIRVYWGFNSPDIRSLSGATRTTSLV